MAPIDSDGQDDQGKLGPWARYANVAPRYLHEALAAHWTLLALAAAGAFFLRGAGATLVAAALLHWACYGWLGIADYPWYSWLLQLAARIHLVFGTTALVGILLLPIGHRLSAGAIPALIVSAAGLAAALLPRSEIARFEHEPAVGDSGFVRVYYEVAELLCADARKQASGGDRPIVLAQEVGILSHYCPDIELRDVNGLASPGMTEETLNDWAYWVRRYEPRHLVVLEHDPGERREFPAHQGSTGSRYQNILRRQAHPVAVYRRAVAGASEGGDPP